MTIFKRIRDTPTYYPPVHYQIRAADMIDISVKNPVVSLGSFKTDGKFPLEEMININTVHAPEASAKVIAPKAGPPGAPAVVTLNHCRFYTRSVHKEMFNLSEAGGAAGATPFDQIGYVMGGLMERTDARRSPVVITGLQDGRLELPAEDPNTGKEFVYEIIIDNHCTKTTECQKQVDVAPAPPPVYRTDFFFYYDVLEETNATVRKFDLVKRELPFGAPSSLLGGSTDVAACNPVILSPPEPYD
jgi:hypothetical protein